MTPDEIDALVLKILASQAPDYACTADASAFVACELKPPEVEESFGRLEKTGAIEEKDGGWVITNPGADTADKLPALEDLVAPAPVPDDKTPVADPLVALADALVKAPDFEAAQTAIRSWQEVFS